MAQDFAPSSPRLLGAFVERDGRLSQDGLSFLEQMWRQVAAGFAPVPCVATGTNEITLTPILHREGGRTYADHMAFVAPAAATSTGSVTAGAGSLPKLKVYVDGDGTTQAGSGDLVEDVLYAFTYYAALDSGNGGFVRGAPAGKFQPLDSDLTAIAALTTTEYGRGLLEAETGTWTPTVTFATPGDLSVTYANQDGDYALRGTLVRVRCYLLFTPTFSTSSGALIISLPFSPASNSPLPISLINDQWDWSSRTMVSAHAPTNQDGAFVIGAGSGLGRLIFGPTNMTSGGEHELNFEGEYEVTP